LQLQEQVKRLKIQLYYILKAWLPFRTEAQALIDKAKEDKLLQKKTVAAIDLLSEAFSLKTALRLLGLNAPQYREWNVLSQLRCSCSGTSLCLRRFPNQISKDEVHKYALRKRLYPQIRQRNMLGKNMPHFNTHSFFKAIHGVDVMAI
jgi:hypothetical protein